MRMNYSVTLVLMVQFFVGFGALLPNTSVAEVTNVSCTNINDPNLRACNVSEAELLGLVKNLRDIDTCQGQLDENNHCETANFSCDRDIELGTLACDFNGVNHNVLNISCTTISTTDATCVVTNNISAQNANLEPGSVIGNRLTKNQRLFATTLLNVCNNYFSISPTLQNDCDLILSLVSGNDPSAAELIDAITPDAASAALDASQTGIKAQNRNIAQRMSDLRRAGADRKEQVSFNGLQFIENGKPVDIHQRYPEWPGISGGGASADEPGGKLGTFINGTVDAGEKDTTDAERGFEFSGGEYTAGADYRMSSEMFLGMAFGYSASGTDVKDNRGSLDHQGFNLILYASFYPAPNTYVDTNFVIGGGQFDQQRRIRFSYTNTTPPPAAFDINQVISASYFGYQKSFSLTAGHEFPLGALSLSPYGSLMIVTSRTDDYNESASNPNDPGAGFALHMDDQEYASRTLAVGGQLTYALNFGWGVMVPQAKLELIKETKTDINVVTGNFIGDPNKAQFRLPTDEPDSSYAQLGLGTSAIMPGGNTVYGYYQTYLGFDGFSYYSLNLGMRWEIGG